MASMETTAAATKYREFLESKAKLGTATGFEPIWMPDFLFDFQSYLVDWSLRLGRAAIFSECGTGKSAMQLVWAENVVRKTNKPVLVVTPIAVGQQTIAEAEKFGVSALRTRDGKHTGKACVWVTNYEQLHKYDPADFAGLVCDESSAIKDMKSERKKVVTEFTRKLPYRLLCTATAAPNDHFELGTSSEVLGNLGARDMMTIFFKQEQTGGARWNNGGPRAKFRFRGHAEQPFWQWVCSWARSLRKPSDLGFDDTRFILPPLIEKTYLVQTAKPRAGMLFTIPARDMREERAERRHSIVERCEQAVELADHPGPAVLWCELNDESDRLTKMLDDCVQVSGSMSDDEKEENLRAFTTGQVRRLVTKPKIGAWGLNWQHCSNVIVFPSHSFEQYYQLVRRCYRFGQTQPVNVSLVLCEGEENIVASIQRKQEQASRMFDEIVRHMADSMHIASNDHFPETEEIPTWL